MWFPICDKVEFARRKRYSCPEWVEALLWEIDREMARVHWNVFHKEMDSPFLNTGNKYMNPIFEVSAYSWSDDDEDEVNFRCKDIEISWYKHLGRCTEININPNEEGFNEKMIDMFNECMKAVTEGEG